MHTVSTSLRSPPGPDAPVALGIDADTLATLSAMRDEYGDIVAMTTPGGRNAWFVNDPAEVRRILVRRHPNYRKGRGFERVKMLLGNGLIVSEGDVWRRARTMIQPAFKPQNIHRLLPLMVRCTERAAQRWSAVAARGETLNITHETNRFALELIIISIFGDDVDADTLGGDDCPFAFLAQDSARNLAMVMKVRVLRDRIRDIVASRRSAGPTEAYDFLAMYLAATDKNGEPFEDTALLDELITLIVAGFETSANTLNWFWYLIAGHAAIESELLDEVQQTMPDQAAVSFDAANAMTNTQHVLDEVLRLYPPVWLFTRQAIEDDTIADYDIPAGTDVYLSPFILQRTESLWPDAEAFNPQRFADAADASKEGRFFPFSLGPRRCLGEYFSYLEMKIHIAMLLPRFAMRRVAGDAPALELGINLRAANDIYLRPELRISNDESA